MERIKYKVNFQHLVHEYSEATVVKYNIVTLNETWELPPYVNIFEYIRDLFEVLGTITVEFNANSYSTSLKIK